MSRKNEGKGNKETMKIKTAKKSSAKKVVAKKAPAKKPAAKAASKKQPSAAARKKAAEELALRRCWLAAGLGLLAFLGFLSFFSVRGFLVQGYQTAFRWLLGYGEEALPLCLLICAVLLVVKRRKRVRVQAVCWAVCPLLFGAVRHVLTVPEGAEGLKPAALGASGMALTSGGRSTQAQLMPMPTTA